MAVTFDAVGPSSSGAGTTSAGPLSWTHTGSGDALLVGVSVDAGSDTGITCTCTCDGTAMTSLGKVESAAAGQGFLQVFAAAGLSGTSHAIVATASGGAPPNDMEGGSLSFTGAGATVGAAFGTPATANPGIGSACAVTLPSSTSGNMVAAFLADGDTISSVSSPATSRFIVNQMGGGGSGTGNAAGATSPSTGSSVTTTWTVGTTFAAMLTVEVLAAGGGAAAVTYVPPRTVPAAPPSPAPWGQKDRRNANLVATAANPLTTPLDSAWQADARYWHLYGDTAARDRRAYFTQRNYVSDPNLLQPAPNADPLALNPEQSPSSDLWRVAVVPAFYDRREVPQQRAYYGPPVTAQLENELLGGADTARHQMAAAYTDRREVPQQRPYISDPSTYPAEVQVGAGTTEAWWGVDTGDFYLAQRIRVSDPGMLAPPVSFDPVLGGQDDLGRRWRQAATHYDRREVPWQPPRLADPLLIATAELENELLGGADTGRHWLPAAFTDRREVPQQRQYLGADLTTAQLENELLGGGDTARHYLTSVYIDRREVPQQRPYISDPSAYPAPNPPDITLSAWLPWWLAHNATATHYDRREVPQQRAYISDPSTYPTIPPTDPLTVAWGAGGSYWHLYHRAEDITDRREYPAERAYVSDPLLLTAALLENELLGGAGTAARYLAPASHADRREVPAQRAYYGPPVTALLENELLGGAQTWLRYNTPAWAGRGEVPAQPARTSDPSLLGAAPADPLTLAWGAGGPYWHLYNIPPGHADRRLAPAQRPYLSDPSAYPPRNDLDPLLAGQGLFTRHVLAAYLNRRLVPAQHAYLSDPSFYPAGTPAPAPAALGYARAGSYPLGGVRAGVTDPPAGTGGIQAGTWP